MFRVKRIDESSYDSKWDWKEVETPDELIDADTFTIDNPFVVFTKEGKVIAAFHDYEAKRIEEYDE